MLKKCFVLLLVMMMLFAVGCDISGGQDAQTEPPVPSTPEEEPQVQPPSTEDEDLEPDPILNEYEDLEITAAILIRRAILPGTSSPVNVTVTNNGDKTITYVQGSGSYETPDALTAHFEKLQPVVAQDRLGIATMDYVTKELAPGESLEFVMHVMMVQPNEKFDDYTHDIYNDGEAYIADYDWLELQELYPDLEPAEPGSYTGQIRFYYSIVGDDSNPFGGPTGYAETEIQIGIDD